MTKKNEERLSCNGFSLMKFDSEAINFYNEWIIKPHMFDLSELENKDCITLSEDHELTLNLSNTTLIIPNNVFESDILPAIGTRSLLKNYLLNDSNFSILESFVKSVFSAALNGFIFFFTDEDKLCKEKEVVSVRSLFTNDGEIEYLDQEALNVLNKVKELCLDDEYSVINAEAGEQASKIKMILSKTSDTFNPTIVPCVIVEIDIVKFSFKQYGAVYWKNYDSFIILPRNYAKGGVKEFNSIVKHVAHFFTDVDKDEDYSKEYFELNESNTSSYCLKLLHEGITLNGNYKLSNILMNVQLELDRTRATKTKREKMYKCLGLLIAMKHRCCEKCRHLDTSLI